MWCNTKNMLLVSDYGMMTTSEFITATIFFVLLPAQGRKKGVERTLTQADPTNREINILYKT